MANVSITTPQLRRILDDERCSGSVESQNVHLQQLSRSLRDPRHSADDRDTFMEVARRIDGAVAISNVWGMRLLLAVTSFITGLSQSLSADTSAALRKPLRSLDAQAPPPAAANPLRILIAAGVGLCAPVFGCIANWFLARSEARKVHAAILKNDKVLAPLMIPKHAMMIQFEREKNGSYTISIYNAGGGLENHLAIRRENVPKHISDTTQTSDKLPTAWHVKQVSAAALTPKMLAKICGIPMYRNPIACIRGMLDGLGIDRWFFRQTVRALYWDWAASLGRVEQGTVQQAHQKAGSCTYKSTLAFLRNNLPEPAYMRFKLRWLERVKASYPSRRPEHQTLVKRLDDKIARAKARAKKA